jgi:cystathionine beta-lyase
MIEDFDDVDIDRLRARRTVKWSLYGPDVLAAWVAEMDFDVAPVVRSALLDAVAREDFGYAEPDLGALTGAAADFFATRYGRPVVAAPMLRTERTDGLDLDAIDAGLAGGARAVLLCSPHNPTGRVFTREELVGLAAVVEAHGARVIADEVHAPLVYDGARHVPYAAVSDATAAHTVTVTSVSKAFNLAGLKCAQVVASNHDDAARWRRLRVFEVPGPTPLGIATTTAAYRDGGPWLDALVGYLAANVDRLGALLVEELPGVRWHRPQATFLTWLDCSALGLDDPARWFLDHARVAVSDGPPFGPHCDDFVRLNVATSRELLDQIVGAMGVAMRSRR